MIEGSSDGGDGGDDDDNGGDEGDGERRAETRITDAIWLEGWRVGGKGMDLFIITN